MFIYGSRNHPAAVRAGSNFPHRASGELRTSTSTEWAFFVQVAVPTRLPDAGRLMGSNPLLHVPLRMVDITDRHK